MSIGKYITIDISILVSLFYFGLQPNTAFAQVLFQDGFESGNFSKWTYVWTPGDVTINSDPQFVHSGNYSVKLHYFAGTAAQGFGERQDTNRLVEKVFNPGYDYFRVSGWLYLGTPVKQDMQRKLYYLMDPEGPRGENYRWGVILTSHNFELALASGCPIPPDAGSEIYQAGDDATSWGLYPLKPKTWYKLDMEVKANTPGQRDGYVKVWVNDTQVLNRQNMNLRGTLTTKITRFKVGQQVDRFGYDLVDEYRYWDDITIIGASDTSAPLPPTGVRVQ